MLQSTVKQSVVIAPSGAAISHQIIIIIIIPTTKLTISWGTLSLRMNQWLQWFSLAQVLFQSHGLLEFPPVRNKEKKFKPEEMFKTVCFCLLILCFNLIFTLYCSTGQMPSYFIEIPSVYKQINTLLVFAVIIFNMSYWFMYYKQFFNPCLIDFSFF